MLKLALRILIVATIGYILATQFVSRSFSYLLEPITADLVYETLRGQMHALRTELDPQPPAEREAYLRDHIKPHYGLGLQIKTPAQAALTRAERDMVDKYGIVMRDDYNTFLSRMPGEPAQWLEVTLPSQRSLEKMVTWTAWTVLVLILAGVLLLFWAMPIHRDLDVVRNATLRMAQGDLDVRVRLSRISGIRHIGESFNHMAERIAALVDNQRSLTNAVSHELRTPLARLSFEVDMLSEGGIDPKRSAVLHDMRADIAELEAMVAELLVYARLERPAEDTVKLETVDTADWMGEALAQVAHQARARSVQCAMRPGCPAHVRLHPRYMSRALLNLVQNAVRYANSRVEIGLTRNAAEEFELTVDDDGGGIPQADRERVFEPFIRLDESRDRGTGGAGLGLAIVQRVAANHGGTIEVRDSPLGGARFVLRWPA
ncbi:ATP-binding protein [Achromobacter sp. AONIH1]|uniref:ATP-binding protein n=1 Tax=unclassified Achromobacter TaxID=2626865 RepID=UPI000CD16E0C|nr:ATP-binding protein [Achromobacter sp. AONIH1]AUT48176.1 two-component sensor histidine kinase [Achromobacter sp. AONIH1]